MIYKYLIPEFKIIQVISIHLINNIHILYKDPDSNFINKQIKIIFVSTYIIYFIETSNKLKKYLFFIFYLLYNDSQFPNGRSRNKRHEHQRCLCDPNRVHKKASI